MPPQLHVLIYLISQRSGYREKIEEKRVQLGWYLPEKAYGVWAEPAYWWSDPSNAINSYSSKTVKYYHLDL